MTFLFDIGNVLLKLHFDRFHTTILGAPEAPLPAKFAEAKILYEIGAMSDLEFVDHSLKILNSRFTPQDFTRAWQDIFSVNQPMWDLVRHLKAQNHRLILFSNTNNLHARYFLENFPDFELFDHHHFSHDAGALKPHPDFFQKAINHYQLDPAQTLYLDDLPANIDTGREFGFPSWQYDFNQHQTCLDWLASRKIPLAPPP